MGSIGGKADRAGAQARGVGIDRGPGAQAGAGVAGSRDPSSGGELKADALDAEALARFAEAVRPEPRAVVDAGTER